jgi:uncharacterized membrane protein YgcG
VRRLAIALVAAAIVTLPGQAHAQTGESIHTYDVAIAIERDGSMEVTERIDYDFGAVPHHGVFRDIPTRSWVDDTYDRVMPIDMVSVTATGGAPAGYDVSQVANGETEIKVGDPDVEVTGRHVYTIVYRVRGALNAFEDHDELYWNAVGTGWTVVIDDVTVTVIGPGAVTRAICYAGPEDATESCDRARVTKDGTAAFSQTTLFPHQALTVVVAMPKGLVSPEPKPILVERWSIVRAFAVTPPTAGGAAGVLVLGIGAFTWLVWRRGRDRRFAGSQVDQVIGNPGGPQEPVPLFDADSSGPVEFAPPEGIRPGQIGTLVDERADTLDVTATIVDLAVRSYLLIEEVPKDGWFHKPDWKLTRLEAPGDELLSYERSLLAKLFAGGDEVTLSELRTTFHEKLVKVEDALYKDAVTRKWFRERPDKVRATWHARGWGLMVVGGGVTFALARWTHAGLVGVAVLLVGVVFALGSRWMPSRTAAGTAMLRRVRGFRTVIETAETNMSRWAEEEHVFTRYLPYAIVFGCTDRWAKAFAALGAIPADDMAWYRSTRPFNYGEFGHAMESFTVTTGGTIASSPAASGSSGFSGGSSGGGGGGGGGGSW